jgi:hypothetical protein
MSRMPSATAELLRRIRSGEGSYTSINRGVAGDTPGGDPSLTSKTIAQILAAQKKGTKFAVGAYQFIPQTLEGTVRRSGLDPNTRFTPQVQDQLAMELILGGQKRPGLTSYLTGKSNNLGGATDDIANEWAALRNSKGRGSYDGDSAGNKASIGVADLLPQVRAEVMKNGGQIPLVQAAPDGPAAPGRSQGGTGTLGPSGTPALASADPDQVWVDRISQAMAEGAADPFAKAFGTAPTRMAGSRLGGVIAPIAPL